MNLTTRNGYTRLELTEHDTQAWANRPNNHWPCSTTAGHAITAEFDTQGNLTDLECDLDDIPSDEFDALMTDFLPVGHPGRR